MLNDHHIYMVLLKALPLIIMWEYYSFHFHCLHSSFLACKRVRLLQEKSKLPNKLCLTSAIPLMVYSGTGHHYKETTDLWKPASHWEAISQASPWILQGYSLDTWKSRTSHHKTEQEKRRSLAGKLSTWSILPGAGSAVMNWPSSKRENKNELIYQLGSTAPDWTSDMDLLINLMLGRFDTRSRAHSWKCIFQHMMEETEQVGNLNRSFCWKQNRTSVILGFSTMLQNLRTLCVCFSPSQKYPKFYVALQKKDRQKEK